MIAEAGKKLPICDKCGLPEDGRRVRNVTPRPNGAHECADCAALAREGAATDDRQRVDQADQGQA